MTRSPRRSPRSLLLVLAIAIPSVAVGAMGDNVVSEVRTFLSFGGTGDGAAAARLVTPTPRRSPAKPVEFPREAEAIREALDTEPPAGAAAELIQRLGILGSRSDVEFLLPFSEHPNQRVSFAAMNALGRLGGDRAIGRLTTMALSADSSVNSNATASLGLSDDPAAVDALEELAGHTDTWRRQSALDALALRGGAKARRIIHRAFVSGPPSESWSVAQSVATLGGPADIRLLVTTAGNRNDPRADSAVWALGTLSTPEVDDVLIELAETATGPRRDAALGALANVRDPRAVDLLLDGWAQSATHRYTVLATLGASKAPGALDALLSLTDFIRPDHATWFADALSARAEPTAREVLRLLATEDGPIAQAALTALAAAGDEGVIELLVARFDETGRLPPAETLNHLALHGGEDGWSLIEEVLSEGTQADRNYVVWALQARGDVHATDRLLDLVQNGDTWTASTAMGALEGMGEDARDGLRSHLLERVEDSDGADFDSVASALARLGGDEARDLMVLRLTDGTESERWAAISALGQMDDPSAREALEAQLKSDDPSVRSSVLQTLLWDGTGDISPDILDAALADEDVSVRTTAIGALAQSGTQESVERLLMFVDDEDPMIRQTAISTLGATQAPEAEAVLIEALTDPELSSTAMYSLQSMGSREGAAAIRDLATDGDLDQRVAAIGMLGSDPSREAGDILAASLLDGDATEASTALYALQSRGTTNAAETIAELLDSLDEDDETGLRWQAASTLQGIGGAVARDHADLLEEILGESAAGLMDINDWGCGGPYLY